MKFFLTLFLPIILLGQSYDLKTLIEVGLQHNQNIHAKESMIDSKNKEVEAKKSDYWPTIDVGVSHSMITPKNLINPKHTTAGFASISMVLYDGGRRDALLQAKIFEKKASLFEKKAYEKSITLKIINQYFTHQKLNATLKVLDERAYELRTQIKRIKGFKFAGLSTQEQVDRLQAVYDNNTYNIAQTKMAILSTKENLSLLSTLDVANIKQSTLEDKKITFELFDVNKILEKKIKSLHQHIKASYSGYSPQVVLSDTYMRAKYNDLSPSPIPNSDGFLIEEQNTLKLSVTMRLFDKGKMRKKKEALHYQKMSLTSQLNYAIQEQKMHFRLAKENLKTFNSKLQSSKSALTSAKSTYRVIKRKFEAGLTDNITYLDALTQKTVAQSHYKETGYDKEIAQSIYYYYGGKDPKKFIK